MVADYPEILEGSTNKYQNWETTDPERWVPHGYAVVRVDSRGAGWSPGFMDPACPREIDDLYQCIEWAGTQPWCNGKVGMLGISYYASNQWRVAGKHPPHLAAIIPWEGQNDRYRDSGYHGGILCEFQKRWAQAPGREHPVRRRRAREEEPEHRRVGRRARSRCPKRSWRRTASTRSRSSKKHPLRRRLAPRAHGRSLARSRSRSSRAPTGAARASIRAATSTASPRRRSTRRSGWRCTATRTGRSSRAPTALDLQKRFFDHFLKGVDNGWDKQPPRAAERPPSRRALRAAPRERMAAGAHAVDEVLPRSRTQALAHAPARRSERRVRGARATA